MRYLELSIETTTEACDIVAEIAREEGANGVYIYDKNDLDARGEYAKWDTLDDELIARIPHNPIVKAVFSVERASEAGTALARIESLRDIPTDERYIDFGTLAGSLDEKDDAEWIDTWREYFKPFRVGERIVVKPTWEEYTPNATDVVLNLDPGMAFGTGTHETTSMCLEVLERVVRGGERVVDVGCGSGILAIAALKLGASSALAMDFDPDAVRVAASNISTNNLDKRIIAAQADLLAANDGVAIEYLREPCDIMCANILADIIIRLAPQAIGAIRSGGLMIASGIIRDRAEDVRAALSREGFDVLQETTQGEWVAMLCKVNRA